MTKMYGIFPGEDYLQDFWGPVRRGFEDSFAYEGVYLAASDDEVAETISSITSANPNLGDAVIVGPMRHGERYYAEYLAAGGAFFPLAEGVDESAYGLLNDTDGMQFVFNPDPRAATTLVAAEICRNTGADYAHRVIKLYGTEYADSRVDLVLDQLVELCGASIEVHSELRAYFRRPLAYELTLKALIKDTTVTTIVAANDRMILGALQGRKRVRNFQLQRLISRSFSTRFG